MNVYFCILIPVKMRKIEHIGIAVHDLENSNELFSKLFGEAAYKTEEVASEGVKTSFFMCGPNKIELLEATNENSPIAKFLEKKKLKHSYRTKNKITDFKQFQTKK